MIYLGSSISPREPVLSTVPLPSATLLTDQPISIRPQPSSASWAQAWRWWEIGQWMAKGQASCLPPRFFCFSGFGSNTLDSSASQKLVLRRHFKLRPTRLFTHAYFSLTLPFLHTCTEFMTCSSLHMRPQKVTLPLLPPCSRPSSTRIAKEVRVYWPSHIIHDKVWHVAYGSIC